MTIVSILFFIRICWELILINFSWIIIFTLSAEFLFRWQPNLMKFYVAFTVHYIFWEVAYYYQPWISKLLFVSICSGIRFLPKYILLFVIPNFIVIMFRFLWDAHFSDTIFGLYSLLL